ncbi:MAG TPA: peptide chain release factor 2 [Patescibacteria group bacterium]|jgi:peptide chain release factor 2|nr:peptide chain release factor 2 [Patescibacteria group bacterium]
MQPIQKSIQKLNDQIKQALAKLGADKLQAELKTLQAQMAETDFWQDNIKAQLVVQKEAKLRMQLEPWLKIENEAKDLLELAGAGDEALLVELTEQLAEAEQQYSKLKKDLQFSGRYDDHDVILRLHAGAGGTDAQDWTEMLLRMYLRWAERSGMKTELIEESRGEEAGIKSVMISVSGAYAFGKLRGEHGVHRLVRLSPFNADHLRQTSFALVEVLPQIDAPDEVQIDDKDLRIDVYRAGGHGGQSVNTTDSAVRVTHLPTGITVSIQNERSQLQNKETAMKVLRSKLAQLALEQHQETVANLKGPTQSAEWGSQIRSYVLHPYTLVKDNRTKYEEHDAQAVLDGKLDGFIESYGETTLN